MDAQREKLAKLWRKSCDEDFEAMHSLFLKGHYTWALFVGHLIIEKLLKIHYMCLFDKDAPRIHDLGRLAELAQIEMTPVEEKELATLTAFNIRARYPDYKFKIYSAASKGYTTKQIEVVKRWRERLRDLR